MSREQSLLKQKISDVATELFFARGFQVVTVDEIAAAADVSKTALATEMAGPKPDGTAKLVAGLIVLTWRTAYSEAIHTFEHARSAKKATADFLAIIDRGFAMARQMAR